jgi:catechol 2,3-dioxygenase-like lactoylglutathione lyase family enzyme
MWWGTAIEAPDPGALARFYSGLLGWPIGHEEPGTAILAAPPGSVFIVFQQATNYQAPVWPPVDGEQRPMMHFDFQVGDLDSAVAEAVALGATLAAHQPQENVRVLLDPAGHPLLPLPRRRLVRARSSTTAEVGQPRWPCAQATENSLAGPRS